MFSRARAAWDSSPVGKACKRVSGWADHIDKVKGRWTAFSGVVATFWGGLSYLVDSWGVPTVFTVAVLLMGLAFMTVGVRAVLRSQKHETTSAAPPPTTSTRRTYDNEGPPSVATSSASDALNEHGQQWQDLYNEGWRLKQGLPDLFRATGGRFYPPTTEDDVEHWKRGVIASFSGDPELVAIFETHRPRSFLDTAWYGMNPGARDIDFRLEALKWIIEHHGKR